MNLRLALRGRNRRQRNQTDAGDNLLHSHRHLPSDWPLDVCALDPFTIRIHAGNRRRGMLKAGFQRPLLLRDLEQRGIKLYERVVHRGVIRMTLHAPGDVFA